MRAFIGIDLPKDLKEKIFSFSQEIGRQYKIKLVEKENLHLTFLFLGEISEEEKERVVRILGDLGDLGGIKLSLGKAEIFPVEKRSHGIWINVEGEKEKLFSLYKKIVDGLLTAGIKLEEKYLRFSPHITVGRFRARLGSTARFAARRESRRGRMGDLGDLSAGRQGLREGFLVEKVTFFESKLSDKGPKYSKIGEFEVK